MPRSCRGGRGRGVPPRLESYPTPARSQAASARRGEAILLDRVFGPDSTQTQVYEELSPLITSILDGVQRVRLRVRPNRLGKDVHHGRMHRRRRGGRRRRRCQRTSARRTLRGGPRRAVAADGTTFAISVEMREIYNEQVRDLLNPAEKESSWKGGSSGARLAASATRGPGTGRGIARGLGTAGDPPRRRRTTRRR